MTATQGQQKTAGMGVRAAFTSGQLPLERATPRGRRMDVSGAWRDCIWWNTGKLLGGGWDWKRKNWASLPPTGSLNISSCLSALPMFLISFNISYKSAQENMH